MNVYILNYIYELYITFQKMQYICDIAMVAQKSSSGIWQYPLLLELELAAGALFSCETCVAKAANLFLQMVANVARWNG